MRTRSYTKSITVVLLVFFLATRTSRATPTEFYFTLYGDTSFGHEISLIDSNGQLRLMGTASDGMYLYQYVDTETSQEFWDTNPSLAGGSIFATGAWKIEPTYFHGTFEPAGLALEPGSKYYLYDNATGVFSDPLWVDEGFVRAVAIPGSGMPDLPVKVFGNRVKVLGKAEFLGKTEFLGKATFSAPVRITPAGDLSMGSFTSTPAF